MKTKEGIVGPPWIFSDDVPEAEASLKALGRRLQADPPLLVVPAHTGVAEGKALVAYGL